MGDQYVDSSCRKCDTELVQLGGDWICPNCNDVEQFTTSGGDDYDFVV